MEPNERRELQEQAEHARARADVAAGSLNHDHSGPCWWPW